MLGHLANLFRILDLLGPLRQIFQDFGPSSTGTSTGRAWAGLPEKNRHVEVLACQIQTWGIRDCLKQVAGCSALQPSFEESTLDLPESWANLENDNLYIVNTTDIARLQWWEMFNDSNLSSLIKSGLKANPDFTIAKIDFFKV